MPVTKEMLEAAHKAFDANWFDQVTDDHFTAIFTAMLDAAPKPEEPPLAPVPSYHDLHITTALTPRTSIFDLPFNVRVTCTRLGGWELWGKTRGDHQPELELIAGEYHDTNGLRLDVAGHVIVDSLTPKL